MLKSRSPNKLDGVVIEMSEKIQTPMSYYKTWMTNEYSFQIATNKITLCNFDYLTSGKLQNYFTHIMKLLVGNPHYWKFLTRQIWMLATMEQSKWTGCCLVTKSCLTLATPWTTAHQSPLSWDSLGKNMEWVAMPSSRGIFLIHGMNLGLLHCRWNPHHESLGKPELPVITVKTLPLPPMSRISIEWQNVTQGAGSYIIS